MRSEASEALPAQSSSVAVRRGESLSDCGRTTSRPMPAAKSRKPIDVVKDLDCSQRKPMGWITTAEWPSWRSA